MRIISGEHKGKRLIAPKNLPVRPTTDFAKEGLFNILNNRIYFPEVSLLELFAGTGNISYEFASRGTKNITCVDAHFGCIKFISETASKLDFTIHAIKSDVTKYIEKPKGKYDIIFADPPYNFSEKELEDLIETLFKNDFVSSDGFVIIEHTKHNDLSNIANYTESRRYGGSVFSFFG